MKKYYLVLIFLISIQLFAEISADEIMTINDNLKEPEYVSNITTMVLIDRNGNKKIRKMEMFSMKTPVGENSYMEFLLPADVRGTKFLTIGNNESDDEQRLFLPALKRIRKISSSNKDGKFMGSDITYYDMESRNLKDFTYKFIGETVVDNRSCWIIESTPVKPDSPYSKVTSYISKDDYFVYKRKMFNDDNKLIKILTIVETDLINGIIIPVKTVFENLKDNHKTLLAVTDIKFDSNVDESKFTIKNLK